MPAAARHAGKSQAVQKVLAVPRVVLNCSGAAGAPGELFWTSGKVTRGVSNNPVVVGVHLNGLRWNAPFLVVVDAANMWLGVVGKCFEAQVNLECTGPETLCIFNPRPLGQIQANPKELLEELQRLSFKTKEGHGGSI